MSKRSILRQRRQQTRRQNLIVVTVGMVVIALALIGFSIYQNSRPAGDMIRPAREPLPYADGKALGKAEAPVLIQEFSDFQ